MALQTSGAISFADIQAEFGGSNPISLSEYYRGGSYVPSEIVGSWSSTQYSTTSGAEYYVELGGVAGVMINWAGTVYYSSSSIFIVSAGDTFYEPGYEYEAIALQYSYQDKYLGAYQRWSIRRRTRIYPANASVPTQNTIDLSDFYGGRKT